MFAPKLESDLQDWGIRMRNIWLYGQFLRVAVLGKAQYKADFFVGIASVLVLNAVNLSLIGILVYNFNTLGNW